MIKVDSWLRKERGSSFLSFLIELPILILVAFVIAWVIKTVVVQPFFIPSSSMEPTLLPGDHVLVNKFVFRTRQPKRGEIVVFKYPADPSKDFIKRVVALEGETVQIRDGQVFVDGTPMKQEFVSEEHDPTNFGPVKVTEGKLFVMGDNRTSSFDSRQFGLLPRKNILGKAFFVYWPLVRLGSLS